MEEILKPVGGTELQEDLLHKYADANILGDFQICTSVPEKIPLSSNKINVLWQQNSYDQPNLQPWFQNKENHKKYFYYIFNSNWCYEKFRMAYDLPLDRCVVIKNAIEPIVRRPALKEKRTIRMLYTSTPWRGLNVLLGAMQLLEDVDVHLDVYSSTKIYGKDFYDANNDRYKPLFEQASQMKNVTYVGYKPNDFITKNLATYDIFPYSNTWEETSCISMIEAMAAGLQIITTNYGALYETCCDWPSYINYTKNYKLMSQAFAEAIRAIAKEMYKETTQTFLNSQADYYNKFYTWEQRRHEWNSTLSNIREMHRHG